MLGTMESEIKGGCVVILVLYCIVCWRRFLRFSAFICDGLECPVDGIGVSVCKSGMIEQFTTLVHLP